MSQSLQDSYTHENSLHNSDMRSELIWDFNNQRQIEIDRHRGFVLSAENQIKLLEQNTTLGAIRQIRHLESVVVWRETEIEKLEKEKINEV